MFRDKNINKKIAILVLLGSVSQGVVASIRPSLAGEVAFAGEQRRVTIAMALGEASIAKKRQVERLFLTSMAVMSLTQAGEGPEVLATFQYSDRRKVVFTVAGAMRSVFYIRDLTDLQARTMCVRLNHYMNATVPQDERPLRDLLGIDNDDEITQVGLREKTLQVLQIS